MIKWCQLETRMKPDEWWTTVLRLLYLSTWTIVVCFIIFWWWWQNAEHDRYRQQLSRRDTAPCLSLPESTMQCPHSLHGVGTRYCGTYRSRLLFSIAERGTGTTVLILLLSPQKIWRDSTFAQREKKTPDEILWKTCKKDVSDSTRCTKMHVKIQIWAWTILRVVTNPMEIIKKT